MIDRRTGSEEEEEEEEESDRVIETGLDGLEVQRTEAPRPRWLSQVLARIYTEHK